MVADGGKDVKKPCKIGQGFSAAASASSFSARVGRECSPLPYPREPAWRALDITSARSRITSMSALNTAPPPSVRISLK